MICITTEIRLYRTRTGAMRWVRKPSFIGWLSCQKKWWGVAILLFSIAVKSGPLLMNSGSSMFVPFSSYFVLSSHFVVSTNSTCPFLSFHVPHLILCSQSKPREDKAGTGRKAQKEVRIHEILTVLSFLLSKPQRRCPFLMPNYPSSWNSILFVPPLGTDLPPTC